MPRVAIPIKTPGEGDCFFAALSFNFYYTFVQARKVRMLIAAWMAKAMYKAPYDDLAALTNYVLAATCDEDLYYYRLHMTETAACKEIQRLWGSSIPNANPRNGNGCSLAAWIVWLQYDAEQIEQLQKNPPGYAALRNARFLEYTLWGDTDLTGFAISALAGQPLVVYHDGDTKENLEAIKPLNIYYTNDPHHFSAVRFVDPGEDEAWMEVAQVDTYDEEDVLSTKPCVKKLLDRDLVQIDPTALLEHVSRKKSVSTQYSTPPMSLPVRKKAFELCLLILTATREAMGGKRKCTSIETIDFATFPRPPIYVISSNRSLWLGSVFWSDLFVGQLVVRGAGRAIIFVVDAAEADLYRKNLNIAEASKKGVYVLACSGGFGMSWSRHCALKHARENKLPYAWIFDDNVARIGTDLDDVDDKILKQLPAYSYSSRTPLIMERAVGFNLEVLASLDVNFCPFFTYNKDDKSLEEVLRAKGFDYDSVASALGYSPGVKKIDKGTFKSDSESGIKDLDYRKDIEARIAALDIWRDASTNKAVDILKHIKGHAGPREVMKWHADIMWNILKKNTDIALALAPWFSDAGT